MVCDRTCGPSTMGEAQYHKSQILSRPEHDGTFTDDSIRRQLTLSNSNTGGKLGFHFLNIPLS